MAINTGQAIAVAGKSQTKGTPATGSGGFGIRLAPSPGMQLIKTLIENPTIRNDGISDVPSTGTAHSAGSYQGVFSIGSWDNLIEAAFRGTFSGGGPKTLVQGTTERYFTMEEYRTTMAKSKLFYDSKVTKLSFSAQPDANIIITVTMMGLDADSANSQSLTSADYKTSTPLIMADGTITINGTPYSTLTGFSFDLDLGGDAPSVLAPVSPDVFLANAKLSGSFSAMHQDMVFFQNFKDDDQMDFEIVCEERGGGHSCTWTIGNALLTGDDTPMGGSSFMPETCPWVAGAYLDGSDHTMLKFETDTEGES